MYAKVILNEGLSNKLMFEAIVYKILIKFEIIQNVFRDL